MLRSAIWKSTTLRVMVTALLALGLYSTAAPAATAQINS